MNNTKCSIDDYNYAKEVYKLFGCKRIKDYNNLYVKTDVLLLADAYASYRKNSRISFFFFLISNFYIFIKKSK